MAHSEPSQPVCEKLAVKKRMKRECFMDIHGWTRVDGTQRMATRVKGRHEYA